MKDRSSKASVRFRNSVIKTQVSQYLCRYEDLKEGYFYTEPIDKSSQEIIAKEELRDYALLAT